MLRRVLGSIQRAAMAQSLRWPLADVAMDEEASQVRCTGPLRGKVCRKLLGFVKGKHFRLEIECPRCKYRNIYTRATMPTEDRRKVVRIPQSPSY